MILPTSPDFRGFQGLLQQNPHGSKVGFHGGQSLSNRCLPSQARGAEREWLFRKRLEKVGDLLAHTKLMHLYTPILKHGTHTHKSLSYTHKIASLVTTLGVGLGKKRVDLQKRNLSS